MKKIFEYGTIVITTILTLANLVRLIPDDSKQFEGILGFFNTIGKNSNITTIYLIVVLLMSVLVIGKSVYDIKNDIKRHSFVPGSKNFVKFFSKWYSKKGKLSIICSNLDWTTERDSMDIFKALRKKSIDHELILYVDEKQAEENYDENIKKLVELGAVIKHVPSGMLDTYTYSTLTYMGTVNSIIVRNKSINHKSNRVIFEEIENEYMPGLLTFFLDRE